MWFLVDHVWWQFACFEFDGNRIIDSVTIIRDYAQSWQLGDADRDGRTDLLCASDSNGNRPYYFVYENPDSASLPTSRIWEYTPPALSAGHYVGLMSDFDADSASELALMYPARFGVQIFKCTGDNCYDLVDSITNPGLGVILNIATAPDLDRDGRPELLASTDCGYVLVYECDDSNRIRLRYRFGVGPWNMLDGIGTALDMDRDGRNEAIFFGSNPDDTGTVLVVESPANDSFEVVWLSRFRSPYFTAHDVAVGDMDGDGVPEFAIPSDSLLLYRCTGPDQYERFWTGPRCGPAVGMYDLNRDGKDELICQIHLSKTVIYEHFSLGIEEQVRRGLEQVISGPSVVRHGAIVRLAGGLSQAEVAAAAEAVDVAGRIVAVPGDCRSGAEWQTGSVQPGAYFIRVSSAGQTVTRKLLILP